MLQILSAVSDVCVLQEEHSAPIALSACLLAKGGITRPVKHIGELSAARPLAVQTAADMRSLSGGSRGPVATALFVVS